MTYQRKHKMWTGVEIARLGRFWPAMSKDGLLAEFAPRSWESIKAMAYQNGFKRPRHLGGKTSWVKVAKEHRPTFHFPEVPAPQPKRPWS